MSKNWAFRWAAVLSVIAIFMPLDTVRANDQTSFIIDMTHAYYAKGLCSGVDVVYDNFVNAAKAKHLNVEIVEEVRKGVAFLNTNGQMGEKPRKDVEDTIILAAKMVGGEVSLDQKTTVVSWCKFRSRSLLEHGFIKIVETRPTNEEINKRIDEQFAEMRKSMPMQVSAVSKLTNVFRTGMTLNYTYEDKLSADKWTEADKKKLLADITKALCDGMNTRLTLDLGYASVGMHLDESGTFFAQTYVDKSKCK
jgi:hypothetical protein